MNEKAALYKAWQQEFNKKVEAVGDPNFPIFFLLILGFSTARQNLEIATDVVVKAINAGAVRYGRQSYEVTLEMLQQLDLSDPKWQSLAGEVMGVSHALVEERPKSLLFTTEGQKNTAAADMMKSVQRRALSILTQSGKT